MPSYLHEALVELVRARPELAVELITDVFGAALPEHRTVTMESGELTQLAPVEYRADAVVVLRDAASRPVWALVVEVQLRRDPDKRWSWCSYLGGLAGRSRCPVTLVVICPDPGVAAWCARPIELGLPGTSIGHLVLGPDQVPQVTDSAAAARHPELTVLSAIAHGPTSTDVLDTLPAAFAAIDVDRAKMYCDIVFDLLPLAARNHLEALVNVETYEPRHEVVRRYVAARREAERRAEAEIEAEVRAQDQAEGQARGQANAVLTVLATRGIEVSEPARQRISGCTDLEQLATWVRRAVTAGSVEELFDGES